MPCWVIAQKQEYSSVGILLANTNKDTNTVKFFDSLAYRYSNIDPDSGLMFAEKALDLASKLQWEKGIAAANSAFGINYHTKADYYKALDYSIKALGIYKKLNDKRSIAAILSHIAITYQQQGNYTKALKYHLESLTLMEELGDKKSQAILLEHIGTLYKEQNDYAHTFEYYNAALLINKELNDTIGLARNYGNLGIVYNAQKKYARALESHLSALKANKRAGDEYGMQINMANIAITYLYLGDFNKSLDFHLKALKLSEDIDNKSSIAINLGNVGETYLAIAKSKGNRQLNKSSLKNAIKYLEQAVDLCRAISFLAPTTEFIPYLAEAYAMSGNFRKSYEYQKLYSVIKDSIFSVESKLQIANLETQRNITLKEKDLKLKEQQIKIIELKLAKKHDMQILYLMGFVILTLVLGITIKSIISYRESNRLLTREKKAATHIILSQHTKINEHTKTLEEIAHKHSHDIRGHVATILGLSQLFNKEDYADPANVTIVDGISDSVESLDEVIKDIVKTKVV